MKTNARNILSDFAFDNEKKVSFTRLNLRNATLNFTGEWSNQQVELVNRFIKLYFHINRSASQYISELKSGKFLTIYPKSWEKDVQYEFSHFNKLLVELNHALHCPDYHWLTITQSAVVTSTGKIISSIAPTHHDELIRRVEKIEGEECADDWRIGYICSNGFFLEKLEARDIAETAYQVMPSSGYQADLESKELW